MELITKLLTVLGVGAIELWAAIPTGLALQLHPVAIGVTAAIGAILGALVVVLLGGRVRTWLLRRYSGEKRKGRFGRIYGIWHRHGVLGLGLLAPLITGAPLGVALGLTLGVKASRLLFSISLGIVLWSVVSTLLGTLGLTVIDVLRH